ncbi:MAG TPA: hypothetical protein VFE31_11380 [Opitutaceae bacterium]|jgi:hypothetical protein|nr:hypothetical protein [Opitutaceae bacterium]
MKTTSLYRIGGMLALATAALAIRTAAQTDEAPPPPPPPPAGYNAGAAPEAPPPPPPVTNEYSEPAPPPPVAEQPLMSVELPPGLSHGQVQAAILAALQHRDWTVVSTGEHTVVGHLLHHHVDATVTLSFNRRRVDFYATSYLVGHHADDRIMSFTREDWIQNLRHDILHYVNHGTP